MTIKAEFDSLEAEVAYYDKEYKPDYLLHTKDVVDGFDDQREHELKPYSTYFKEEEIIALKYLSLEIGANISISDIVQKATETYEYSKEEVALFKQQKDREGSKVSTISLSPQTRERHKKTAANLGLTGNQFYRMCINGVIKKRAESAWMKEKREKKNETE